MPVNPQHRLSQYETPTTVVTECSCGLSLVAIDDDGQASMAAHLGYPSVRVMNAQHDPFHFRLARALLGTDSPTLLRLVHDDPSYATDDQVAYEEAMVLAAQRFTTAVAHG